ncbi:MAG: hypothetical protein AAGA20_09845 [Planctomycetota bacterium]
MIQHGLPRILVTLAAGAGCIALAARPLASPAGAPAQEAEQAEPAGEEEHDALHESMEVLQGGMRTLRKALSKPEQKETAIALCREMQAAALVGFAHVPEPVEPLEGTALLEHSVDFRRRMLEVCTALIDLEVALDKEDADAAKTLYRALGKQKSDGHDLYIE